MPLTREEIERAEELIAREKNGIDFASPTLSDKEAILLARYINNLGETDAAELVGFARGTYKGNVVALDGKPDGNGKET